MTTPKREDDTREQKSDDFLDVALAGQDVSEARRKFLKGESTWAEYIAQDNATQ